MSKGVKINSPQQCHSQAFCTRSSFYPSTHTSVLRSSEPLNHHDRQAIQRVRPLGSDDRRGVQPWQEPGRSGKGVKLVFGELQSMCSVQRQPAGYQLCGNVASGASLPCFLLSYFTLFKEKPVMFFNECEIAKLVKFLMLSTTSFIKRHWLDQVPQM